MTSILFDATRLLLRGPRASPTGIDRVSLAYARWLLERSDIDLMPVWGLGGILAPMPIERFRRMIEGALRGANRETQSSEPSADWNRLTNALASKSMPMGAMRSRKRAAPSIAAGAWYAKAAVRAPRLLAGMQLPPDAIYLNVSHFGLENPGLLERLAKGGVRPVVMVHDLIPIRHPEFCGPGAAERHTGRIHGALAHAGLIIANSQSTADDLVDYACASGIEPPRISVAALGIEHVFNRRQEPLPLSGPYFICVGTIEPRKNLVFLLSVWRRLAERLGDNAPRLVIVGRRGWENEAVIDHLERSPAILRLVHEVSDLHDSELARLISGATALLAPSLAEGFDFTTLEALSLGTPVIASEIPAHCEMARGAVFVDPLDGLGWVAAVEKSLIEQRRGPTFTPPTWREHFQIVGASLG